MDIFKKNEEKPTLAELKRAEVEKKAFELGFEVGYHKHSEIGWVKENIVKLENLTISLGLGDIVTGKYIQGKDEGNLAREKGLKIASAISAPNKEEAYPLSEELVFKGLKEESSSGYKEYLWNDAVFPLLSRPECLEYPSCISLPKSFERPKNVDGFKPLMPKK
ncbi:hypothetical protein ACT9XH_12545 [Methanococcoides methylutens]|uniref:hypothetical protein n=1 Tax=Methanococcoides methylutens TaxID=2226 RepID=UPI004044DFD6